MKNVLYSELQNEKCNAAALGMYNAGAEISSQNFVEEAKELIGNIELDVQAVNRNINYWKNNGSKQEVDRYTERKEQLLKQIQDLKQKYNL